MQFYVKDIMSVDIVTINEDTLIRGLIKKLVSSDVLGVPVVNKKGNIVGVVSSNDILKNEASHSFYKEPRLFNLEQGLFENAKFFEQPVASIMNKDLYVIEPDATINEMAKIMYDKKIHRLLVIEYEKLVGIVSTFDLLKLLASNEDIEIE